MFSVDRHSTRQAMALFKSQSPLQEGPDSARSSISSPVFRSLVNAIPGDDKYVILDVGPACGPNIEFFSRFNCKLYIADVIDSLIRLRPGTEENPVDIDSKIRKLLPYDGSEGFDAVLLWDIVNYLNPAVCLALISHLRSFLGSGTSAHAFISALRQIPAEPGRYRIISEDQMECLTASQNSLPGPQFTQRDIEKLMPRFAVRRSVLLQSGMQEYLFVAR